MKLNVPIIIVVIMAIIVIVYNFKSPANTIVDVFRDITDIHISQPKFKDITSFYNLDNNQWEGATFRFVDITEVSFNRIYKANLESDLRWFSNEFERKSKVKKFYAEISRILNTSTKATIGKDNSSIYIPIANQLNFLHKNLYNNKIMLIYSDLMENNSTGMSFYDSQKLNLIKSNPESVIKYFESLVPLYDLKGIKIYIIFQPNNIEQDEQFKIMSGFYKKLFEDKGAEVKVVANLS